MICFSLFAVVMTPRGGGPLGAGGLSLFAVVCSLDAVIIYPSRGCPLGARYSGLLVQLVIPLPISKSSLISSCFSLFAVVMTPLGGGGSSLGGLSRLVRL